MTIKYYLIDTELYHHGILGQKCGVRRYQNADGSLTVSGRKRYKKLGSADNAERIKADQDIRIKAGTSFYRVSKNDNESDDIRYLSYRTNDRNFYRGY